MKNVGFATETINVRRIRNNQNKNREGEEWQN
jgi:hypothetical protein